MPIRICIRNQLGLSFQRTPENVSSGHGRFLSNFPPYKTNSPSFRMATLHKKNKKKISILSIVSILCSKSINSIDTKFFRYLPSLVSGSYSKIQDLSPITTHSRNWESFSINCKKSRHLLCLLMSFCSCKRFSEPFLIKFFSSPIRWLKSDEQLWELISTPPWSFLLSANLNAQGRKVCRCFCQFLKMKVFHCVLYLQSILSFDRLNHQKTWPFDETPSLGLLKLGRSFCWNASEFVAKSDGIPLLCAKTRAET